MSKYNLMDLYEGMSDKDYDAAKEAERLEAHPEKDKIKAVQAMMAKEKSSKNESEVEEVSSRVGSRIEGLLNIEMKNKFLNAGMDLIQDVLEDDEFFIEDIIDHLAIELNKYYDERASLGSKINDLEETESIDELAGTESVDALTALIGAGGLAGGAVALSKLMDSLEAGKLGDKGKAVAKFLRNAGSTFSGQGASMKEEELEETPGPKNPDGTPKSNDEMTDDEREDYYNDLDDVNEASKEDKELKEHFSRFLKDYK